MQFIPFLDDSASAFHLRQNAKSECALDLIAQPPGSRAAPTAIWSRRFDTIDDRDTLLGAVTKGRLDPVFLGRLTMMFGSAALDELADRLIAAARAERAEEVEKAAKRARNHFVVNLYAREGKHGRHVLELQRRNSDEAEWSVTYDRAIERDRLCDWLRWQKERFLGFLDHAAEHGGEALSRMLVDEMFVAERRVKAEGRGAGGTRPLRMWRGD
ncbi:hypothetical protein [uncultured Sphingomonas sp.]|uniref:hypothetical protein n=1 Tax=uncultured Sphingomonas sp. TaxID=158754 RepID=UPI0035CA3DD7